MFAVQEMVVEIETASLNEIIGIVNKITTVFQTFEDEYLSAQIIKEKQVGIEESKESAEYVKREAICPSLEASVPTLTDVEHLSAERKYFEFVNIGAIKISLTLKFEHKKLNLEMNKGFGIQSLGYTLISNIANVSNSPLKFSELVITNVYSAPSELIQRIVMYYSKNGIFQFYKIIGSSDLIGNPVGFVDKLGSGVFELFNEPKKGLLKGPTGFVGGVGKGVTSLVGGVASASFDSLSKITGSLYNVTKDFTGQSVEAQDAPTGVADGIFEGAKGGLSELGSGITGLITNPIDSAKKGGIGGFFTGVGKGIVGAVASPFTATFKVASSVTAGIGTTSTNLTTGKVEKQSRIRYPRYIGPTGVVNEYQEDQALAQFVVNSIAKGKYASESIKFSTNFYKYTKSKKSANYIFVVTDKHMFLVENQIEIVSKCKIADIQKVETFTDGMDVQTKNSIHHLTVQATRKRSFEFLSDKHFDIVKSAEILKS